MQRIVLQCPGNKPVMTDLKYQNIVTSIKLNICFIFIVFFLATSIQLEMI